MTEVYDYIAANIPVALVSIMLIPLGFLAIWRVLVKALNNK